MQVALWYDWVEVNELLDGEEVGCGEGRIIADALAATHSECRAVQRGGGVMDVMVVMLIDVCVHCAQRKSVSHRPHTHSHTHSHYGF